MHKTMRATEAREALLSIALLQIETFDNLSLSRRALEMASELGLKAAYDAHYLALAQQFGAELWTADARLVKAVANEIDWIRLSRNPR